MKIAYFTPLSPIRSGISHYSEELLPHLSRYADIDVYIDNYKPTNRRIAGEYPIRSYKRFRRKSSDYDQIVYQMGNFAPYHEFIYNNMLYYPGLVVLHDYIYFHFFSGITLARGDSEGFKKIMSWCYGGRGVREAEKAMAGACDQFRYSLVGKLLDSSLGAIVHSDYVRTLAIQEAPVSRLWTVPMGVTFTDRCSDSQRHQIRRRLGFTSKDYVVASFGRLAPHKRLDISLRAFALLQKSHPQARYLIVGESPPEFCIRELVRELELESSVILTGYVNDSDYQDFLRAADFCVNLRYPTAGETSIAILKAMEMGVPVAVSNYAQFAEFPDDCVVKVDLGVHQEDLLFEYMRCLADDEVLRRRIGDNARQYIHRSHSLEAAAKGYFEALKGATEEPEHAPNGSGVVDEILSPLADLGGKKGRETISTVTDSVLKELGVLPGEPGLNRPSPLSKGLSQYRYLRRELRQQLRTRGVVAAGRYTADRIASRLGRSIETESGSVLSSDYLKCREIFEEVCVLPDGRVVCSCIDPLAERCLGDLNEQQVYDVFNDPHFQRYRRAQLAGEPLEWCQTCVFRNEGLKKTDHTVMPEIKALQVEIINACNLRCPECHLSQRARPNQPQKVMSYEFFTDMIDQLKGNLRIIKFFNVGEPFLHPDCMRMLRYVKQTDPEIAIVISTNGTRINERIQEELVELGIDVIVFSVDGATQEIYARYRVGGVLADVLATMRGLLHRRSQKGAIKPFVIWQYILFEWNDHDEAIRRAKQKAVEIGVDALTWQLTTTRGASKRFLLGSDALAGLVTRDDFGNSAIMSAWVPFATRATRGYRHEWNNPELQTLCQKVDNLCFGDRVVRDAVGMGGVRP